MFKGAIHVHSKYSDGEFTIPELREIFEAAGCNFICITDHSEYFDESCLSAYVAECATLSDANFCIVPGMEFSCRERMHVLGYGSAFLVKTAEPEEVIGYISNQGGIAVIAHPRNEAFDWIESFHVLPDGIETWNTKYDGRYAPRAGTFSLLRRLRKRKPEMRAFYGQDLHWRKQYRGLFTLIEGTVMRSDAILRALARGEYSACKDGLTLPADGNISQTMLREFQRKHDRSDSLKRLAKNVKKLADLVGVSVPGALKSHLRRFF